MPKYLLIIVLALLLVVPLASQAEHRAYSLVADYYDTPVGGRAGFRPAERVYGGIVPHHLLVKDWLAKYFAGLSGQSYDAVVLIGPNHADAGHAKIIISGEAFNTPFGQLEPDGLLARKLSAANIAQLDEGPFASEQSIANLAGFIKKAFPQAAFLPIIIRRDATAAEVDALAAALSANLDPSRTLVLASVDFSHYQTAAVADFHDARTNGCLAAFDYACLLTAEVDSPLSLRSVLKYLAVAGAAKDTLVYRTNSSALLNQPDEPGTSHSFHIFTKGGAAKASAFNFLFFGDLMLDRHVGELIKKQGGQVDFLVNGLSGQEQRFWMGNDLTSANLESALTNAGAHYPPSAGIDFAFAPELLAQFKNYNFNYFNIANNHITDQGTKGFAETQANLKSLGYAYAGCGDGAVRPDCSGTIMQVRDKRIALLGASMVYGEIDRAKLAAEIARLKPQVDLVIVQLHWGTEYQAQFAQKQQKLAHYLIDNGADLIIGHHPHVIEGAEIYKNKAIFYSLGNFLFDQYWSLPTQRGLAVGITWSSREFSYQLFPLVAKQSAVSLAKGLEKTRLLRQVAAVSAVTAAQKSLLEQGYLSTAGN